MHNSIDSMQAPTLTEEDAARLEARLLEIAELETMMQQRPHYDDGLYEETLTGRKLSKHHYGDANDLEGWEW